MSHAHARIRKLQERVGARVRVGAEAPAPCGHKRRGKDARDPERGKQRDVQGRGNIQGGREGRKRGAVGGLGGEEEGGAGRARTRRRVGEGGLEGGRERDAGRERERGRERGKEGEGERTDAIRTRLGIVTIYGKLLDFERQNYLRY